MEVTPHENLLLDGYRLIRPLGRGGFGEVWLCRSEAMGGYHAIKLVTATGDDQREKEYQSLVLFRQAAARIRSPHLVPIEHINAVGRLLYYVMPLADGTGSDDPADPAWQPLSLATVICRRASMAAWFSSAEIRALFSPILHALQKLSEAGLVHRDVKSDNILFFQGQPCLGDISLLGLDAENVTRRGTPGYATPSWYVGGHPDMYGAAATLYNLLTGNTPDKMGRSAFLWPPQGEASLSMAEREEWKRLHAVIRRAADERVAERYPDFNAVAAALGRQQESATRGHPRRWHAALASMGLIGMAGVALRSNFQTRITRTQPPQAPPPPAAPPTPELTPDEKADYQAHVAMIEGYLEDGNYANALVSVDSLFSTYPQSLKQPGYSIARATALKSLGKVGEAKEELRKPVHLSPEIAAMNLRKRLWEELGDLAGAEADVTRILEQFGPNTFPLSLRADVRAQRGDFPGVEADRLAAETAHPEEIQQRKLVAIMWDSLAKKYPGYAAYRKTLPPAPATVPASAATAGHDNAWVLDVFDSIMAGIVSPSATPSPETMRARRMLADSCRSSFAQAQYEPALRLLDQAINTIPALANTPALSLFRALLLQRLGRLEETDHELTRVCHRQTDQEQVDARISLLNALGKRREAEELLTRMLKALPDRSPDSAARALPLLALRARIRAVLGNFPGVLADRQASIARLAAEHTADDSAARVLLPDSGLSQERRVSETWREIQSRYPDYDAYLKGLPGK
jgi:serine/threonine protein kinase